MERILGSSEDENQQFNVTARSRSGSFLQTAI
jgi:hypothetical protein